jgi:hypothetical protein
MSNNNSDDILDIDADTETMNEQLNRQLNKKESSDRQEESKKVCIIDKNVLKTLIIEWLALDDEIKEYRNVIKDMTDEKKQYEDQILELMKALEQEIIITDKGNLTRNVKESKGPLTPELIKTTLSEILKCHQTAHAYTSQIMDKRQVKEKVNLKRKDINTKKNKKTK